AGTRAGGPTVLSSLAQTRVGRPSISTFANRSASDWLKRKLVTGRAIFPFSIRNVPSRVRPVKETMRGLRGRMYQNLVIRTPRFVALIMSSTPASPPDMIRLEAPGFGGTPCRLAQNLE